MDSNCRCGIRNKHASWAHLCSPGHWSNLDGRPCWTGEELTWPLMQFKASQEKSGDWKDYDENAGWKQGFAMVDEGQDGNKEEEDGNKEEEDEMATMMEEAGWQEGQDGNFPMEEQDGNKEKEDEMATMMAQWVLEDKDKTWELERPEELAAVPMPNAKFPVKRVGATNCRSFHVHKLHSFF